MWSKSVEQPRSIIILCKLKPPIGKTSPSASSCGTKIHVGLIGGKLIGPSMVWALPLAKE